MNEVYVAMRETSIGEHVASRELDRESKRVIKEKAGYDMTEANSCTLAPSTPSHAEVNTQASLAVGLLSNHQEQS